MLENVKNALEHRSSARLPRGEFWIGTNILVERKGKDDIEAHVAFCREMGMDFVSVPVGLQEEHRANYRMFNPREIQDAVKSGLFVVAVVSGPFQRVVDEKGLQAALENMARNASGLRKVMEREAKGVNLLIEACTSYGASAVMIAEDIASDTGCFFAPRMFRNFFQPLYSELVDNTHRRGAFALFHSCGNITYLMPEIVSSKFDGLSCQIECLDILSIKRTYGAQITLFTGLSGQALENEFLSAGEEQQFSNIVTVLGVNGGFVLSSSSGLYGSSFVCKLKKLYELADKAWARLTS